MEEAKPKQMLIVEQVPILTEPQQDCLVLLAAEHGLDQYTTRQKLLGSGLAMLGQGKKETVDKIATILRDGGLKVSTIVPSRPTFGPERLRSLEVSDDALILTTQKGEVRIEPGMKVVGILADISGAVSDKIGKRLLAHSVYRGTTASAGIEESEIRRVIIMSSPVFDLYVLGEKGGAVAAVRARPAKFAPDGLGERAGISSKANLSALVDLVEEWSDDFSLHTRFGLSVLPGCRIQSQQEGNDWEQNTLRNLVRFGWLMTDMVVQAPKPQPEESASGRLTPGQVAAGVLLGRPDLAVVGGDQIPGVKEVAETIDKAIGEKEVSPVEDEVPVADSGLPMPPYPQKESASWDQMFKFGSGALVVTVLTVAGSGAAIGRMAGASVESGLVPGLIAAGCFYIGFNQFLLKRRIENTPTSRIRSLAMGMVEIHGRARRQFALVSPMTQTPCVYYRIRRYRRHERKSWRLTSDTNSGHVPFMIEDGTGQVSVNPLGATVSAGEKQQGSAGQANMMFGGKGESNRNERWVEETIAEGTSLYVLGSASVLKKSGKSLNERKIEKLRDLKLDRAELNKYDTDGDGQISADEWQAAREDVEDKVLRESLETRQTAEKQEDAIVISRSIHRNRPFVIAATHSEALLTKKYAIISGILLTGSLFFGLWGLVAALKYFSLLGL
jgi:hypothetical protein